VRTIGTLAFTAALTAALTACGDTSAPARQPAAATPSLPVQPSPFPDVGMSPDVSNAAISACRSKLDAETDGNIEIVGSEYSEANVVVYMVVGPQRAPWRCLTANDARYAEVEFMGSEGAL
jgi:hypothetical protein